MPLRQTNAKSCHQHLYKKENRCRASYCLTSGLQISANVQENEKHEESRETAQISPSAFKVNTSHEAKYNVRCTIINTNSHKRMKYNVNIISIILHSVNDNFIINWNPILTNKQQLKSKVLYVMQKNVIKSNVPLKRWVYSGRTIRVKSLLTILFTAFSL